ncbi:M15 family metallopeptidase [Emticicia agri]|uniref:D-alanyl-D-alanine dipeptidase n=1 Tax=Emticicia agri TaxID=2492393 RepID=A0A4Q5M369_9BACT|nr:M15 family metallopeptidase [Emticicia agri]RYU96499.1 peptidase M15 [Emticicia agri]
MTKLKLILGFFTIIQLIASCTSQTKTENTDSLTADSTQIQKDTVTIVDENKIPELEQRMIDQGLVNIQTIDSTIMVELKYSTTDNFVHTDVYGDLTRAYMQQKPAEMLAKASKILQSKYPNYRLLVYDSSRPLTVQHKFWALLDTVPPIKRADFVANPAEGSIHNFGSAVDLTVYDLTTQKPLDMGTKYDYFGDLAYPIYEEQMLKEGRLTKEQIANRLVLRNAMEKAGYMRIDSEWWHFNALSRAKAKELYKIIE